MEDFCNQAYESSQLYKEQTKRWFDQRIKERQFIHDQQSHTFQFQVEVVPRKAKIPLARAIQNFQSHQS